MLRRSLVLVAMAVIAATAAFVAPANAAKPVGGSFSTTLVVVPTVVPVTVDGLNFTFTVSGSLDATVNRFQVSDGRVLAVGTASGTLTVTEPTLGSATITVTNARLVLTAQVTADCSGNLRIDLRGVLQLDATVQFTILGVSATIPINETVPLNASLSYMATTQQQQSLICDIATLLGNRSSPNALADKLNTLLKRL